MAKRCKRRYIGIEQNPEYVKIAEKRLEETDGVKFGGKEVPRETRIPWEKSNDPNDFMDASANINSDAT